MDTLLETIDVCDVDGFCFGNYTDEEAGTGCTVIVAPEGATGGVDVRGGAPASRETDLLRPENTVDKVHGLEYGDSPSNHAMTFTGVNLGEDGKPNRWKIGRAHV